MAINISVQFNGGLLPDIILLTKGYHHRGTRLNAMKRFCLYSVRNSILPCLIMYYIVSVLFLPFVWCPCMAISVNYNGELLPDIILLIHSPIILSYKRSVAPVAQRYLETL